MFDKTVIGIEALPGSIRMVCVKGRRNRFDLLSAKDMDIDPQLDWPATVAKIPNLLQAFKDNLGLRAADVVVGICRSQALVRELTLPLEALEKLDNVVRYEVNRLLPLKADDVTYGYHIVEKRPADKQVQILLVATKRKPLEPLFQISAIDGLSLRALEVSSNAVARIWTQRVQKESTPPIVLHVQNTQSAEMIAIVNQKLAYAKWLPEKDTAVLDFEKELLQATHQLGLKETLTTASLFKMNADSIMLPAAAKSSREPTSVHASQVLSPCPSTEMATAFGLAMRGENATSANILPAQYIVKKIHHGRRIAIFLLAVTLLSASAWFGARLHNQWQAIQQLDRQIEGLKTKMEQQENKNAEIALLEERIRYLNQFDASRYQTLAVLLEITKKVPKNAWLQRLEIRGDQITLQGFAAKASEMLPQLESSLLFENAAFLSTITRSRDGKEKFRIGMTVIDEHFPSANEGAIE